MEGLLAGICLIYTVICWILPVYLFARRYIHVSIGDKEQLQQTVGYGTKAQSITTASRIPQAKAPIQQPIQQPRQPPMGNQQ